jgi:hypothetical protein
MKVKDLIKQLEELNKPDAEITLLGNVGHPEDEETDLYFDNLEIWNDGEETITLFVGLSEETLEQIESQKPTDNDDYFGGLLYGVDNNQ